MRRRLPAILLAGWVGCGGGEAHLVTGTLTVDGRPAANAMIALHPIEPAGSRTTLSVATTGPDGSFRLTTRATGLYAVTVVWPDESHPRDECDDVLDHDRFQRAYADPARSPWRIAVGPGRNELPLRAATPASFPTPERIHP